MLPKRKKKDKSGAKDEPADELPRSPSVTTGEKRAWRTRHESLQADGGNDFKGATTMKYRLASGGTSSALEASMSVSQSEAAVSVSYSQPISPKSSNPASPSKFSEDSNFVKKPSNSIAAKMALFEQANSAAEASTAGEASTTTSMASPPRPSATPRFQLEVSPSSTPPPSTISREKSARKIGPGGIDRPLRPSEKSTRIHQQSKDAASANLDTKTLVPGPELDKRRQFIVEELINTEKSHVEGLQRLCTNFRDPFLKVMEEHPKVFDSRVRKLVDSIFCNVQNIKLINETLLDDLTARFENWGPNTLVGDVLRKTGPFFKLYKDYTSNYDTAIQALTDLTKEDWFVQLVPDRYSFESLLILPIQRIPRYRMLVEDLLRHTHADHPDFSNITHSLEVIKDVASFINTAIKESQTAGVLMELGLVHLIAPGRHLIKEGSLTITVMVHYDGTKPKRIKKAHHFILLTDILVFNKENKRDSNRKGTLGKSKLNQPYDGVQWPLELVWLSDIDERSFEIKGPMMTITVESLTRDKADWFKTLTSTTTSILAHIETGGQEGEDEGKLRREGKFTFPSGAVYDGEWDLGRMHGHGCYEYSGTTYEGEFFMNLMQGQGTFEFADGSLYKGDFSSGLPHGTGTYCTTSGDQYTGAWVKGKREGQGTLLLTNGDKYIGEWKANQMEGHGMYAKKLPYKKYMGPFVFGKPHGRGSLETLEGSYVGDFENGKRSGEGTFTSKDQKVYYGAWKSDCYWGQGKLDTSEFQYSGTFVRGLFEGKGRIEYKDEGTVYDGNFRNGLKHGKGKYTSKGTRVASYNGDWQDDNMEGQGDITFSNGDIYTGQIQAGEPHGMGKILFCNGISVEGKFVYGVLEGKVDVHNPGGDLLLSVDETGQVLGAKNSEFLVPPLFPSLFM